MASARRPWRRELSQSALQGPNRPPGGSLKRVDEDVRLRSLPRDRVLDRLTKLGLGDPDIALAVVVEVCVRDLVAVRDCVP
jgi:hypothetical protein